MNPVLLIDGSSLAFLHGGKENYKETLRNHIASLLRRFKTDEFVIVLENSKTNFRNKVAKSNVYKGQRRTKKKKENVKKYLPYLRNVFQEIKENYHPITYLGIENDDAIATLATRMDNAVMVANDVDYNSVPGIVYNLRTNKVHYISYPGEISITAKGKIKATGLYQVYSQVLKGSTKENYKGLEGCGPVSTYKHLKDLSTEEEMQEKCIELFTERYGIEEGVSKLEEGFRLCWVITHNESIKTPKPIKFSELNL